MSWIDDPEATAWARHVIDDLVPMIAGSAATVSIVPTGPSDVKFAVELGISIMLDKPIVALVQPGAQVPSKLAAVADQIVEFDPADAAGTSERVRRALQRLFPGTGDIA